jgi:hypothetical protein
MWAPTRMGLVHSLVTTDAARAEINQPGNGRGTPHSALPTSLGRLKPLRRRPRRYPVRASLATNPPYESSHEL